MDNTLVELAQDQLDTVVEANILEEFPLVLLVKEPVDNIPEVLELEATTLEVVDQEEQEPEDIIPAVLELDNTQEE